MMTKAIQSISMPELSLSLLIAHAPILHNPTNMDKFCVKCDGCSYAVGAILLQERIDDTDGTKRWVIIDMYSKVIKRDLRSSHCAISESLAIAWPLQYWIIHLIRKEFIVATDHKSLTQLFDDIKDITTTTQKQLIRILQIVSQFHFKLYYLPGIYNKIADQLSRLAIKLFQLSPEATPVIEPYINADIPIKSITDNELNELNQ